MAVALLACAASYGAGASHAEELQRHERRSAEMAIPDPVLDPFASGRPIAPPPPPTAARIPDSVDHQELEKDGVMDQTEREAYEKYLIEQGLMQDPHDHLTRDAWDGGSGPDSEAVDDGGYGDPVEW